MPHAAVNNLDLHYERGGSGPPLVLLHGIGSDARAWQHQLQGLAQTCDVIACDMRGFGSSVPVDQPYTVADLAADIAGLLDHLGFERAHLGGLSLGGVVALELYNRFPARVRSLILAGTSAAQGALAEAERQRRLEQRPPEPAALARQRVPTLLSPNAAPEVIAEAEAIMASINPGSYRLAAKAFFESDQRAVLSRIAVPVLVIWGEHDTVTPRAEAEFLVARIPGARLEIIPGAGHLSNQENPAAFNEAVRRFLAGLS